MPDFKLPERLRTRTAWGLASALIVLGGALLWFLSAGGGTGGGRPGPSFSAQAAAQRALAEAQAGSRERENLPPSYRTGLSTESVRSGDSVMLVRRGDFEGVADEPENVMDMLSEMSGGNKRKPSPVRITEESLKTKIMIAGPGGPASARKSAVPAPGEAPGRFAGGPGLITAPVDYLVFRSSQTWAVFSASHNGRFPPVNFSKENMAILVSVSDLPSGIFKIADVRKGPKETVIAYKVDPLAMAAGSEEKEQLLYSASPVPKDLPIRLEQVP